MATPPKVSKPSSIPEADWCRFYELGNKIADFVLDAYDVYASGDFASWEKDRARNMFWTLCKMNEREAIKRRDRVCEYILIERMKEKEVFCCHICQESFFNYKQALIHFATRSHKEKHMEIAAVRESRIASVAEVLKTFTKIPEICASSDKTCEGLRFMGHMLDDDIDLAKTSFEQFHRDNAAMFSELVLPEGLKSGEDAAASLLDATRNTVQKIKGELGRNAMNELHEFLGKHPSYCAYCQFKTGDRGDFYDHYISYVHLKIVDEHFKTEKYHFDPLTTLVNVYKKELA